MTSAAGRRSRHLEAAPRTAPVKSRFDCLAGQLQSNIQSDSNYSSCFFDALYSFNQLQSSPLISIMNFFKTKPRTPPDLVRGLRDAISRLESSAPGGETRRKVRSFSFSAWRAGGFLGTIYSWMICGFSRRMKIYRRIYSRSRLSCTATVVCTDCPITQLVPDVLFFRQTLYQNL